MKECELELENSTPKEHPQYGIQICETKSDPSGKFEFLLIPGAYAVIAIYKGGNTKYDIDPLYQEFTVQHEAFTIPKVFEVKGFTAVGTVFTSPKGSGVPSADIHLNGTFVTRTDKKGIYRLEKTETGWYKIEVKKDFYDFPTEYVKITPAEPKIAMIVGKMPWGMFAVEGSKGSQAQHKNSGTGIWWKFALSRFLFCMLCQFSQWVT